MASRLIVGKILLCFLLPAILSLNISATGGPEESLPWLRYWVVLGIALLLEFLLEKLEGVVFTVVKLVFMLWCLAPVEYNGSDVVFQYVLLPVHQCVQKIATETSAIGLPLLVKSWEVIEDLAEFVAEEVINPLLEIIANGTSAASSAVLSFFAQSYEFIGDITHIWFQKMLPPINCAIAVFQHIAMKIPELMLDGLEKIVYIFGEAPGFATTCFYYCLDIAVVLFNGICELSSASSEKIAEFSIFAFERVVEFCIFAFERVVQFCIFAFLTIVELSRTGGETVMSTLEDGVSYYKNNQANPRLFSEAFKQMIYQ